MSDSLPGFKLQFASDNTAGVCPEALEAFNTANAGFASPYGNDESTAQVCDLLREVFEREELEVFFAFNGTAANSLALASMCQPYQSVICTDAAHVETDECGAPEFFSNGSKLLTAPHHQGKLTAASVDALVKRRTDIHYPRPKAVTITQSTEIGTLYHKGEIAGISQVCRANGLNLHMDGARFANAVASLKCSPADITWRSGVDVLCFGGTKMGLPVGEAILFFNRDQAEDFAYRCKQAGQLASKMRYLSSPWLAMLQQDNWLKHAGHANRMAHLLHDRIADLPGAEMLYPTEANAVLVNLPDAAVHAMHERGWTFYTFIGGSARFMCSWATTEVAIDALVADLASVLQRQA